MHPKLTAAGRRLTALTLAIGLMVAMAAPASATYCVKRNDQYVVCVA